MLNDTPATNPITPPNLLQLARNLQALTAASLIAYDPFTPGSPYCNGSCNWVKTLHIDYPDLVGYISKAWPGNPLLDGDPDPTIKGEEGEGWLTKYKNGQANIPTPEQIAHSIELLQPKEGFWDFQNPLPPAGTTVFDTVATAKAWHSFWTSLGFTVPECTCAPDPSDGGGWEDSVVFPTAPAQNAVSKVSDSTVEVSDATVDTVNATESSSGGPTQATGSDTTSGGVTKRGGWYPGKNLGLGSKLSAGSSAVDSSGSGSGSGSGTGSTSGSSNSSGSDKTGGVTKRGGWHPGKNLGLGSHSGRGSASGSSSSSGSGSGSASSSSSSSGSGSASGSSSSSGSGSGSGSASGSSSSSGSGSGSGGGSGSSSGGSQ